MPIHLLLDHCHFNISLMAELALNETLRFSNSSYGHDVAKGDREMAVLIPRPRC
jgi:hypothetical protein